MRVMSIRRSRRIPFIVQVFSDLVMYHQLVGKVKLVPLSESEKGKIVTI